MSYDPYFYSAVVGTFETTPQEQAAYIASVPSLSSSEVILSIPSAPSNLSVSQQFPTSLSIEFTQDSDGGDPITNYSYSINGGTSFTLSSPAQITSPLIISDLTQSTSYDIVLKAVNSVGESASSDILTASTTSGPSPPTLTTILADDEAVWVYFTAGATGGSPITDYSWSADNITFTPLNLTDLLSPVVIPGLTNGIPYTITLRAITAAGSSSSSNSLTATPLPATSPSPSLNFDPSNSSSYSGSGTTVSNIGSFGAFNGTMTGVTYNAADKGGTFSFDGTDFISFGQYNFGNTTTIIAWINPNPTTNINGLLANVGANQAPSGIKFNWNTWLTNSRTISFEGGNGSQGNSIATEANIITYGAWQQLAYVYDRVNRTVLFFLNGVPANQTSVTSIANLGVNNPTFRIGTFTDGSYGMNAKLGSIKVYNTLLTASDIKNDYDNTSARFA